MLRCLNFAVCSSPAIMGAPSSAQAELTPEQMAQMAQRTQPRGAANPPPPAGTRRTSTPCCFSYPQALHAAGAHMAEAKQRAACLAGCLGVLAPLCRVSASPSRLPNRLPGTTVLAAGGRLLCPAALPAAPRRQATRSGTLLLLFLLACTACRAGTERLLATEVIGVCGA